MPLPEGCLPREGDVLLVRMSVRHNVEAGETDVHVNPPGRRYSNHVVDLKDVDSVACRHFDIGERVIDCHGNCGEVKAVEGDLLWVKSDSGMCTWRASDCDLIPVQDEPEEELPPAPSHPSLTNTEESI